MSHEQGAAVATTSLVGEQPHDSAIQQHVKEPTPCENCGAPVPEKFCGRCGQRHEHAVHSVMHFAQEVTEDLTHADSRLWTTLYALLFKPGFLTREFIDGRRVRYLPPLRLYLVLSVVFFLILSLHHDRSKVAVVKVGNGSSMKVVPADEIAEMAAKPGETQEERKKRVCNPHYDGPLSQFVTPFLSKGCERFLEDRGQTMGEAFIHTLPRVMFVFLPALALAMKPLYRRPRHYYVEHLLFFLHLHAFAFLLFSALMLITRFAASAIGNWCTFLVWLYLPYYLFVSMRRVYGQGGWLTFAKLVVLSFTYFTGAVIALLLTGVYSVFSA